ncbi:swr1-complex protein [Grosmannia clavigera kw1407]|uniref:SWR1-complex protein 5 n=1 Tax=Grosmannia clavigera (strain kw1407 / UAMH 11150) TaxID=655863 RepID=F0XUC9_GROCL|nr:swr1-complex protein [Grosmannia clavigera kw1407]EFW98901.1 swr1-complex protein [Grosmannia clavigera kw1407]
MPPEPPIDEEDYASSEDSDFAPEDAPEHVSSAESDDEAEAAQGDGKQTATTPKRRRDGAADDDAEAEDAGFENSGDEAVIGKGKKKRRRRDKGRQESDDEGGGTGGFVKTRRQRANEKAERRAATVRGPVTVDVEALWAQMTAGPEQQTDTTTGSGEGSGLQDSVHTEEKLVARDSAEAKLYLSSLDGQDVVGVAAATANGTQDTHGDGPERLPPRKAFRSAFEPVIAVPQSGRADLDLGMRARLLAREKAAAQEKARKLNTVEMSRMDWAGFVDKEGIQDELALAGRAKGSYADRQLFLARSEAIREDEARRARLGGKV